MLRCSAWLSRLPGCIAGRKPGSIDLIIFRHLSVRDDGEAVNVSVILGGRSLKDTDWKVTRGSIINREHSGFLREQKADMEKERARMGVDANVYAVAMKVMAGNRAKYVSMSRLRELETLPELSVDDLGRIHFDLTLEGHSVINLRLE